MGRNIFHTREKNLVKFHLSYYERCTDILSYKRDQSSVDFSLIYERFIFPKKIERNFFHIMKDAPTFFHASEINLL